MVPQFVPDIPSRGMLPTFDVLVVTHTELGHVLPYILVVVHLVVVVDGVDDDDAASLDEEEVVAHQEEGDDA